MLVDARSNLEMAVSRIALHVMPMLPDWAMKRRDRREPGKHEKEEFEDKLARIMLRLFVKQKEIIEQMLESQEPGRKVTTTINPNLFDDAFEDDNEILAELFRLLTQAEKHGIELFKVGKPEIDYTLVNSRAAQWARDYAYTLVGEINDVTRRTLQQAISAFVETPGMTIGDVMDLLPFDKERASRVAVTEITRAYSEANQQAGRELAKQFPDVRVMKKWYTNMDAIVCDICAPLEGMEVEIDEGFSTEKGEGVMGPPIHPNDRCWIDTYTALAELD